MANIDFNSSGQTCRICKQFKTFAHFSFRIDSKKYRYDCKSCRNLKQQTYSKTESGKQVQFIADQKRNKKFAKQRQARTKTFFAIKKGLLLPTPCIICGDKSEAHHPDYSRPLDVVWLCKIHHKETHNLTRGISVNRI